MLICERCYRGNLGEPVRELTIDPKDKSKISLKILHFPFAGGLKRKGPRTGPLKLRASDYLRGPLERLPPEGRSVVLG